MSSSADATGDRQAIVAKWSAFLQRYSRGDWPINNPPIAPPVLPSPSVEIEAPVLPSFEIPMYPPGEIEPDVAQRVAEFYTKFRFLPPPRADTESIRSRVIQEYNLYRPDQVANFDRCTSLVNVFFNRVCTFSLFRGHMQVVMSIAGDFPVSPGYELVPEINICSHVVLRREGRAVELAQMLDDWRFAGNPWCRNGSVGGYVGVPIMLEVDPSSTAERPMSLAVGVLALMDTKPIPRLTEQERKVMEDLGSMLSIQIRSTWEGWRRGKEARLRASVSEFLERALVQSPAAKQSGDRGPHRITSGPQALPQEAAELLQKMLDVDLAIVIDLTPFHPVLNRDEGHHRSFNWLDDRRGDAHLRESSSLGLLKILGTSASQSFVDFDHKFHSPSIMSAIASFLSVHAQNGCTAFDTPGRMSGFESFLPTDMNHLAIPFYTATKPNLLILVASATPFYAFSSADITYVGNLGSILIARYVQARIVDADSAKTTFVSHISHELRTPLHGLLSQLELLKDEIANGEMEAAVKLLQGAEFSGTELMDLVDDVLQFGKLSQSDPNVTDEALKPRECVKTDLVHVMFDAARSCWARRLQGMSVTGARHTDAEVEVVVEYQDLGDWIVPIDATGFRRILSNLVGNSIKYTSAGTVCVSLRVLYGKQREGRQLIELRVRDSGRGIAPEFLDQIFEPFTQADSFSPGAGLGLHITKTLVSRMRGEITVQSDLGAGSTFTVVLPVDRAFAPQGPRTPPMLREVVSTDASGTPSPAPLHSTACARDTAPTRPASPMDASVHDAPADIPAPEPPAPQTPPAPPPHVSPQAAAASPAVPAEMDVDRALPVAPQPRPPDGTDERLRVLVVDDNMISRRILVALLKRMKVAVVEAEDGLLAVEAFRTHKPHIVWTDVSMPNMDGITAAGEMRNLEREYGWDPAYIVAITGLGLVNDHLRKEGLLGNAALDEWLIKGQVSLNELREHIKKAIENLKNR